MQRISKGIVLLLVTIMVLLSFAGCSTSREQSDSPEVTTEVAANEKVTETEKSTEPEAEAAEVAPKEEAAPAEDAVPEAEAKPEEEAAAPEAQETTQNEAAPEEETAAEAPEEKMTAAKPETSEEDAPTATVEKKIDLKGRVITYGYNTYFLPPDPLTASGRKRLQHYKSIEEKYNVKIVWNPKKLTYDQVMQGIAAGKPPVDIIAVSTVSNLINNYVKGYIQPLDSSGINFKDTTKYGNNDLSVIKGKHYALAIKNYTAGARILFYNKKLLDAVGVTPEYLNELQKSGKWTWSKFEEIAKKVSDPKNGVYGVVDQDLNFYRSLLASNGADWISMDKSGNLVFSGDTPKAVEATEFYSKLVQTGVLYTPKPTWDVWADISMSSEQNKAAFFVAWNGMLGHPAFKNKSNFGVMFTPKPDGAKNYTSYNPEQAFWAIPSNVENPEEVAIVMDAMFAPYQSDAAYEKDERSILAAYTSDKYSIENFMSLKKIAKFSYSGSVSSTSTGGNIKIDKNESGNGWYDLVCKIANGEMTLSEAVNANKKRFNNALKDIYRVE